MRSVIGAMALAVLSSSRSTAAADGVYADPSLLAGVLHTHEVDEGVSRDVTGAVAGIRATLGFQGHGERVAGRGGVMIEYLAGDNRGLLSFGLEAGLDWPVGCWRVGPRLSVGYGDDLHGEGPQATAGVTARIGDLILGVDLLGRRGTFSGGATPPVYEGTTVGVIGSVGVGGRGGKYVTAIGGGSVAIGWLVPRHRGFDGFTLPPSRGLGLAGDRHCPSSGGRGRP